MSAATDRPRIDLKIYDKPGLVWAYRLTEPVGRVDADVACEAAAAHRMWLHFSLTDAPARRWLSNSAGMPAAALSVFFDARPRAGLTLLPEGVVGVVMDMYHDFHGDPEAFGELRFFVDTQNDRILSVRRHPLRTIDLLRRKLDSGRGFEEPSQFLERLSESLAESFADVVADLVQQVDGIEDEILAGQGLEQRAGLADIRRLLTRFRRHLHHNRAALSGAQGDLDDRGAQPRQPYVSRKTLLRLDGVAQDLDLVHERVRLMQDEVSGLLAEANNRFLYLLSVVTTVLMPATLIASIWGMNVGGLPFSESPHGFTFVSSIISGSVLLAFVGLRKLRGK